MDRSACYMARYIAKNIVAAGLAAPLRSAARLRHRRGRAGLGPGGHLRHRQDRRDCTFTELVRAHFPLTPRGHHRAPEAAPADLPQDRRLRPLRPRRRAPSPGKPRTRPPRCAKPRGRAWPESAGRRASHRETCAHSCQQTTTTAGCVRRQGPGPGRSAASGASSGRTSPCRCSQNIRKQFIKTQPLAGRARLGLPARDHRNRQPDDHAARRRRADRAVRLQPALDAGRRGRHAGARLRDSRSSPSRARTTRSTTRTSCAAAGPPAADHHGRRRGPGDHAAHQAAGAAGRRDRAAPRRPPPA